MSGQPEQEDEYAEGQDLGPDERRALSPLLEGELTRAKS